ncbi:MAG: pitrilysin family protein [Rhodanobacter sp.]
MSKTKMKSNKWLALALFVGACVAAGAANASIAERAQRSTVDGIDVVVYPMDVKDVVTMAGSMPLGDAMVASKSANPAVPALTAMLLQAGTTRHDKFAISEMLSQIGAQMDIDAGSTKVDLYAKSLKQDTDTVIGLLAEQLRMPAFAPAELVKAKTQLKAGLTQRAEDADSRAYEALALSLFPSGSPNAPVPREDQVKAIDSVTVEQIKAFYQKYYGPEHMTLVFTGDVDQAAVKASLNKAFGGWKGGVDFVRSTSGTLKPADAVQSIPLKDKAAVSVMWGETTGLHSSDADYLPLSVGVNVLGSGFTGRLMATVRDKQGLTYGINASLFASDIVDGGFMIQTSFAPELLDKGLASTQQVLNTWWTGGITAKELDARKDALIGRFQIQLGTTDGMAMSILATMERGRSIAWLDQYPGMVKALTVDEINAAIHKHVDPKKLVLVKAGTFAEK